jgi:hypothetical protein
MKTQYCKECAKDLPATEEHFYVNRTNKSGWQSVCKICTSRLRRAKYAAGYRGRKEPAKKKPEIKLKPVPKFSFDDVAFAERVDRTVADLVEVSPYQEA